LKEHLRYLWVSPSELNQLDWAPADIAVVSELSGLIAKGQITGI